MIGMLDTYDWQEAFGYAGEPGTNGTPRIAPCLPGYLIDLTLFTREDVFEIVGFSEGENDELSWMIYGCLQDSRWFYLEAGCDYTGWDCQASGSVVLAHTQAEIERFGLTEEARQRMGVQLDSPLPTS